MTPGVAPPAADAKAARLYDDVIRLIRPAYRTLYAAVETGLAPHGVGVGVRAILERLHDEGPQTTPGLARALGIRRQVAQRMIDAARADGLVRPRPNPAHRRSPLIELTSRGRATITAILDEERRRLEPLAGTLAAEDVAACHRVLDALVTHFATPDALTRSA